MKFLSVNVQKRALKAGAAIENLLNAEDIDVALLQETDLPAEESPPLISGYKPITHRNAVGVARAIIYAKEWLKPNSIEWRQELPIVVIKLPEVTIINTYNEFTLNSYSILRKRLTKSQQVCRITNVLRETA